MQIKELLRRAGRRIIQLAGLDAEVLPTLVFRLWSIFGGAAMVLLIPLWLTQVEQGYYYTFASLLALQVFFELGLGQVVVQLVSHEYAHLRPLAGSQSFDGDTHYIQRLASLIRLLRRWYAWSAVLFVLGVGTAGLIFFQSLGTLDPSSWATAWLLLTAATGSNLYLSWLLTVHEGCGRLAPVARMRLVQSMTGYMVMWLAFAAGAGLWAIAFMPAVGALYTAWWLSRNGGGIRDLQDRGAIGTNSATFRWRTDIFPLQWRIAVSWVSGYFIFQLFTPLIFARQGPAEAGRLGITLAIFNALSIMGMSWVNAKVPSMAAHISR